MGSGFCEGLSTQTVFVPQKSMQKIPTKKKLVKNPRKSAKIQKIEKIPNKIKHSEKIKTPLENQSFSHSRIKIFVHPHIDWSTPSGFSTISFISFTTPICGKDLKEKLEAEQAVSLA